MADLKSLCVYCSSSANVDEKYAVSAKKLGTLMAEEGVRLVYGGSHVGLMGAVADGVMTTGGEVFGVTTRHLDEHEVGHQGITELKVVDDMHARKYMMFEEADAFAILPGGFGTLEEFFEVLTWKQIGLHAKPIILINYDGFWDPLKTLMQELEDQRFVSTKDAHLFHFVDTVDDVIPTIRSAPVVQINPTEKWNKS